MNKTITLRLVYIISDGTFLREDIHSRDELFKALASRIRELPRENVAPPANAVESKSESTHTTASQSTNRKKAKKGKK